MYNVTYYLTTYFVYKLNTYETTHEQNLTKILVPKPKYVRNTFKQTVMYLWIEIVRN